MTKKKTEPKELRSGETYAVGEIVVPPIKKYFVYSTDSSSMLLISRDIFGSSKNRKIEELAYNLVSRKGVKRPYLFNQELVEEQTLPRHFRIYKNFILRNRRRK